tara:strand:+ start:74 stop:454 length:381 start_codon:yes stop_codon:yes gene_type:complete
MGNNKTQNTETADSANTLAPEIENLLAEQDFNEDPLLAVPEIAEEQAEMKNFLINYTGYKMQPEDGKVNINMIAELMAAEFPEFLFAFAEENFIRGYSQGLEDADKGLENAFGLPTGETEEAESEE